MACLIVLLFQPSWAGATSPDKLWAEATEVSAQDQERALTLLNTLVQNYPDHALTDDALFLAGNLLEEKLARPQEARLQYQKLLASFPDSRSALAAKRRLASLDEALGTDGMGAAALIEFESILEKFSQRGAPESLRLAEALAKTNAQWQQIHRVHLWIAATQQGEGNMTAAIARYQYVADGQAPSQAKVQALLGITEACILSSDFGCASGALTRLGQRSDLGDSDHQSVIELTTLLAKSKQRRVLLSGSYVAFAFVQLLFLALLRRESQTWKQTLQRLRRPTTEFFYVLPIACLLILMAMAGHEEIGPAVAIICIGGLVTTWLAGTVMQHSKPLTTSRASLCAIASLLATVSICYLALQRSQLLDLVATTVRFGPE